MPQETVITACLICGGPLSYLQQMLKERFCGAPCRWKYATLAPHQVCEACGRPLSPTEFGARFCASLACRSKLEQQRREHERRQRAALAQMASRTRDRGGRACSESRSRTPIG